MHSVPAACACNEGSAKMNDIGISPQRFRMQGESESDAGHRRRMDHQQTH
jgi:hypothetical protein